MWRARRARSPTSTSLATTMPEQLPGGGELIRAAAAVHRAGSPLLRDTMRLAAFAALLGTMLGLAPLGLTDAHGGQASHLHPQTRQPERDEQQARDLGGQQEREVHVQ